MVHCFWTNLYEILRYRKHGEFSDNVKALGQNSLTVNLSNDQFVRSMEKKDKSGKRRE